MTQKSDNRVFNEILREGIRVNDVERDNVQKLRVSAPQAMIDTDFEYSLQGTKWELVNLNNNVPSVFARANEPAYTAEQVASITISPSGNRDIVVAVNVDPGIPFAVGNPIVLKETADTTFVDGAYVIKALSGNRAFIVTTKSPGPLSAIATNFKTPYTTIFTGDFYANSQLLTLGLSSLSGTKEAVVEFQEPHALFLDSPITVIDVDRPGATYIGSFIVNNILSDSKITYTTDNPINYDSNNSLVEKLSSLRVYARGEGVAIHRFFDGGVQINPGTASPNAQIIRQTRKYFRYQSGKSMQFSTGVLFKPVYEVTNAYTDTTNFNLTSYPFYDFYVTLEQYHGFTPVDEYRQGAIVKFVGFETTNGENPYNKQFEVAEVINSKTFKVKIPVSEFNPFPTTDLNPGGIAEAEVQGWNDASVRTGMFDDQNGIFFECDGDTLTVVKRFSTTPTNGTIKIKTGKRLVESHDGNTKFKTQFKEGDYVVIKGQSYMFSSIINDLSAYVVPSYRGPDIENIKIYKTSEERYNQDQFNLDKLDGTGPSGYVLDLTKMQMIFIDYSWYGAGKIRFGVRSTNGMIIYFHEIYNNNVNRKAYMRSGNLPGRFEIQSRSKTGTLLTSLSTNTLSALISFEDAEILPEKGRIIVNNEYIKYTKSITPATDGIILSLDERNTANLELGPIKANAGDGFISYNQNCSPALSHWGVSVIMDGLFDVDKSYLFTAATSGNFAVNPDERAILSVRLAPSVDFGIPGSFGIRNLVNRSLITLKSIGVAVTRPSQIIAKVNTEHPMFKVESNWLPGGNGSIAQYMDHTGAPGTFNSAGRGGDVVAAFYLTPNITFNTTSRIWESNSFDIDVVRELGNSILGGGGTYPDGPDTLTLFVRTIEGTGSTNGEARARISWTEAQG
jgi:hypothetical protein